MKRVLAVLAGRPGVDAAEEDAEPKTVRVRYDPARVSAGQLVRLIDQADLRLQAHHRLRGWLGAWWPWHRRTNTARLLTDREIRT